VLETRRRSGLNVQIEANTLRISSQPPLNMYPGTPEFSELGLKGLNHDVPEFCDFNQQILFTSRPSS
jgi:hypothetical protein